MAYNKKAYYSKNRKIILEKKKEYYQKNKVALKEKMKLWGKKWYENNKEKVRKLHREYYWDNRERELQRHKVIYLKNREKILESSKKYYWNNRETVALRHKKYNKENKENLLAYKGQWQKIERKINPMWRLNENMGTAIWNSLKDKKAGKKWESFIGYSLDRLMSHLEKGFDKKMNWNNYGTYWAVDHIKPKTLFAYTSEDDPKFKKCWALKNLQPLEKIQNIKKGNRYIG